MPANPKPSGATPLRISKPAPAQVQVLSRHADGSAKETRARLLAGVPSFGAARYEIRNGQPVPLERAETETSPEAVTLRTRNLSVTVSRRGLLEAADAKGAPLLRAPITLAGLFAQPATAIVDSVSAEAGDTVVARGKIAAVPFTATVRLSPYSRLVRLTLEFDFGNGTEVGAKEDLPGVPSFARDSDKLRLTGKHRFDLALAFCETSCDKAGVPGLAEGFSQPLLVSVDQPSVENSFSKLTITPPGHAVLTAAYRDGDHLLIRLWRPAATPAEVQLSVPAAVALWAADLHGRPIRQLSRNGEAELSLRAQEVRGGMGT